MAKTDITQGHLMPGVSQVLLKYANGQQLTPQDISLVNAQLQILSSQDPNYTALKHIADVGASPPAAQGSNDAAVEASFAASKYATPPKSPPAQAGTGAPTMDWASGLGALLHGQNIGVDFPSGNIQPMTSDSPLAAQMPPGNSVTQKIASGGYAGGAAADMAGTDQTRNMPPSHPANWGFSDSPPQPGTSGTQYTAGSGSAIPAEQIIPPSFSGDIMQYPGHSFSGNPYGAGLAANDPMIWAGLYQKAHPGDTDPRAFDASMLSAAQNLAALGALGGTSGSDLTTGPKSDAQQMAIAEDFLGRTVKGGQFADPHVLYQQILNRAAATDPSMIMATPGAGAGSSPGNDDPTAQVKITNNALMQVAPFTGKTGSDTMQTVLAYMGEKYLTGIADGSITGTTYPQWLQANGIQNLV